MSFHTDYRGDFSPSGQPARLMNVNFFHSFHLLSALAPTNSGRPDSCGSNVPLF